MTKRIRKLPALALLTAAVVMGGVGAATAPRESRAMPFPVAELFFELNDSDGDLGIHANIDGGPWTTLKVDDPRDRNLLTIVSQSRLRAQGLTQLAFESAEPSFDELDPADFFRRFPEGAYDIEAELQDGGTLESRVRISHVLAAPPGNITVDGKIPADCEADPGSLPLVPSGLIRFDWDPVISSHPTLGRTGRVTISRYQFFLELPGGTLSQDLPPAVTEFETLVPAGSGRVLKFEIIARTASGNNTAVESCFIVQ
jgi:hypothetical protein